MPELPEVETMRRGIAAIVGQKITDVIQPSSRYRPIKIYPAWDTFKERLIGATVTAVERLGKRVVVRLNNGDSLVLQPKMAGLVLLEESPSPQHVRLEIAFRKQSIGTLKYWDRRGLGTVCLWNQDEFEVHLGPHVLGPDAVGISLAILKRQLAHKMRPVKVALLDQQSIAGIGNLYASEILHLAKVDPHAICYELSHVAWKKIHAAMQTILIEAIAYEGSTLGDGTYRNALNQAGSYQNQHRVYGRAGQLCKTCQRATIVRIVQAQRSTFYCPRCQRPKKQPMAARTAR